MMDQQCQGLGQVESRSRRRGDLGGLAQRRPRRKRRQEASNRTRQRQHLNLVAVAQHQRRLRSTEVHVLDPALVLMRRPKGDDGVFGDEQGAGGMQRQAGRRQPLRIGEMMGQVLRRQRA